MSDEFKNCKYIISLMLLLYIVLGFLIYSSYSMCDTYGLISFFGILIGLILVFWLFIIMLFIHYLKSTYIMDKIISINKEE